LGLPALMAVISIVAGPRAPLFVAPFAGVVLVAVCCWIALLFAGDRTAAPLRAVALAGVAASVAFLIRPALLPGAAALAIIPIMTGNRRTVRVAIFASAIAIGIGLQVWSQWYFYGHPLANGYGPASVLFSLGYLPANARSYRHRPSGNGRDTRDDCRAAVGRRCAVRRVSHL
jgi:hypothetical protein